MTAEIPSEHMHEHGDHGIRQRLNRFAPQFEEYLCLAREPARYISMLGHELWQTDASRAMIGILPRLGDPALRQYNRPKRSPGAVGSILGLEVARQTLGSTWDNKLTKTLTFLAADLEPTSADPSLVERCEQRIRFLTVCDNGWDYGGAYASAFENFAQSRNTIFETSSQIEEAREAFGFVLYATVVTLKSLQNRLALNAHVDLEFTNQAYDFTSNPKLWDTAIERFFEGS